MVQNMEDEPIRKTLTLPLPVWRQIDQLRREAPGPVPSASEVVRWLIREALEARTRAARKAAST